MPINHLENIAYESNYIDANKPVGNCLQTTVMWKTLKCSISTLAYNAEDREWWQTDYLCAHHDTPRTHEQSYSMRWDENVHYCFREWIFKILSLHLFSNLDIQILLSIFFMLICKVILLFHIVWVLFPIFTKSRQQIG